MIINPQTIVEQNIVTWLINQEEQIQQNWIDLTIDTIFKLREWDQNILTLDERSHCKRDQIDLEWYQDWIMKLDKWTYDVEFNENVNIPNWMCALVIARSTVNRGWNFITTWLYDAGFNNKVWGILHINIPLVIQKNIRLAQIIFYEAQEWNLYNWIYNSQMII